MIVRHKAYGNGTVASISEDYIEIDFDSQIRKFQFPQGFDKFLSSDDEELLAKLEKARAKLQITEKKKTGNVSYSVSGTTVKKQPRVYSVVESVDNPLVGARAQTISVSSESEMFEIIGYMATPGRVGSIEAEIPKDGRDRMFEKMFPGQTYRPIEMGNTPSGMPNKLSPQFRINFSNLRNCPEILKKNMGKGNSSCVGRINKSKFVINVVQQYGFRFGDQQDVNAIRAIAEKRGYKEDFERGYLR